MEKTSLNINEKRARDLGIHLLKVGMSWPIENDKIKCRPCSKIGHATCPIDHFRCMNELKLDI